MKVIVKKDKLLKSLQKVLGVVEKRTTMPILNNLLIELEDKMTLKTTNLEISIIIKDDSAIIEEKGKICIPARKFYEIVKSLPENDIDIQLQDKNIVIKSGKSNFKIFSYPPEDFPLIKNINKENKVNINKEKFLESLNKIEYAIYPDESRPSLNGIFIHKIDKKLRFVSSDGFRLTYNEFDFDGESKDIFISKRTVLELKKIYTDTESEDIEIFAEGNTIAFESGNTILLSRLKDTNFPNYIDVIPNNPYKAFVDKNAFIESIKRISTVSEENTKGIILDIKEDRVTIKSSNSEIGSAEDEIDISYDGVPFEIAFNADYLIEAVNPNKSEKIELQFKDAQTAGIITGDSNYKSVIMPIRIQ